MMEARKYYRMINERMKNDPNIYFLSGQHQSSHNEKMKKKEETRCFKFYEELSDMEK